MNYSHNDEKQIGTLNLQFSLLAPPAGWINKNDLISVLRLFHDSSPKWAQNDIVKKIAQKCWNEPSFGLKLFNR